MFAFTLIGWANFPEQGHGTTTMVHRIRQLGMSPAAVDWNETRGVVAPDRRPAALLQFATWKARDEVEVRILPVAGARLVYNRVVPGCGQFRRKRRGIHLLPI